MSRSKRRRKAAGENPGAPSKVLAWRVHPFRESRLRSVLAVGAVAGFTVLAYLFAPEEPFYVAVPPFMFLVLHGFFLPTTYVLSKDSIEVKRFFRSQKVDWGRFRSFNHDEKGAVLSPYEGPARRAMFRCLSLMFDEARREEILDYLRRRLRDVKSESTAAR